VQATNVAVVGTGVRAPGQIAGAAAYWNAVVLGRDLVSDLPDDRRARFSGQWDGSVTRGGYLSGALEFDAKFFGISPREARTMDPQQRLLLEVVWEAFEDAAIRPDTVGSATGVFVGVTGQDYRRWFDGEPGPHWTAGNGNSFVAGRVAHTLGLQGPAMAIDTACSSSLVAIHTACSALRNGEADLAVAAGVNLILAPWTTVALDRTGALSPDGTSRPFDARANGYVRGEGCGVLLLKRLEDAQRDGDRILAVLEGTAVNHDGRSSAFAAPNVSSQARLIERVLASIDLDPTEIGYHEAHGTGTPLGDPIEMAAVAQTLGGTDGQAALYVGSVKANLGHTEAAAGVLGVLKAALCLKNRQIPPQPNFDVLNPEIDLTGTRIAISTAARPWNSQTAARASVSSYGMSGTNAFAVLSAPEPAQRPTLVPVTGFALSARTPEALRELARAYARQLQGLAQQDYPAFSYTATHGRSQLAQSVWIAAEDPAGARPALDALVEGRDHPNLHRLDTAQQQARLEFPSPRAVLDLPAYPWEHKTYAVGSAEEAS
jgi:acyl transferase domain-containing protein